jgi:hypothetical protein
VPSSSSAKRQRSGGVNPGRSAAINVFIAPDSSPNFQSSRAAPVWRSTRSGRACAARRIDSRIAFESDGASRRMSSNAQSAVVGSTAQQSIATCAASRGFFVRSSASASSWPSSNVSFAAARSVCASLMSAGHSSRAA